MEKFSRLFVLISDTIRHTAIGKNCPGISSSPRIPASWPIKGGEASRLYAALPSMEDKKEVEKIKTSLREYCKLDTFAMVKVLGKLRGIAA